MATWDDVERLALAMPETGPKSFYGSRGWAVRGAVFAWERPLRRRDLEDLGDAAPQDAPLGVAVPDLGAKEALLADDPEVFLTTPHFDGHPIVLVRVDRVGLDVLAEVLGESWLVKAPKRLAAEHRPPSR